MFAHTRRNRRRFQPSFEALSLRLAPGIVLPMPADGTLDETSVPAISEPDPRTGQVEPVEQELEASLPEIC